MPTRRQHSANFTVQCNAARISTKPCNTAKCRIKCTDHHQNPCVHVYEQYHGHYTIQKDAPSVLRVVSDEKYNQKNRKKINTFLITHSNFATQSTVKNIFQKLLDPISSVARPSCPMPIKKAQQCLTVQ